MDVQNYRIIVQYQQLGVIASKPRLRTQTDMRWLKYLVDICKEEIMTLKYYDKDNIWTWLHSSPDSSSQLETTLFPINI